MTIDQIDAVLYPTAGSFRSRTDREMTTLTGSIHRDQWQKFLDTVLPQLSEPGWRPEDFERVRTRQLNALTQDLRSNNEEELGKERLQTVIFRGTPYGHVSLGTIAGLKAITLDDVKRYAQTMFTRANLTLGISGDVRDEMLADLRTRLEALPAGTPAPRVSVQGRTPSGIEVDIIKKDTRATAISFGFPIETTRKHPDFVALSIARAWLGEHRLSSGQLYQRIREERGFNYGDYAYIEAFPRGMFQFFPDANIARSKQIFEIWIRPVVPGNAQMALRLAIHELDALAKNGLTKDQFEKTRDYLMKNVYVMTCAPGPAARLRPRLTLVRHSRVHELHARRTADADARSGEQRDQAPPPGTQPVGGHDHGRRGRAEEDARFRRVLGGEVRRSEAEGAARRGQGDRRDEAQYRGREREDHTGRRGVRQVSRFDSAPRRGDTDRQRALGRLLSAAREPLPPIPVRPSTRTFFRPEVSGRQAVNGRRRPCPPSTPCERSQSAGSHRCAPATRMRARDSPVRIPTDPRSPRCATSSTRSHASAGTRAGLLSHEPPSTQASRTAH
jgi:hypothetical protein